MSPAVAPAAFVFSSNKTLPPRAPLPRHARPAGTEPGTGPGQSEGNSIMSTYDRNSRHRYFCVRPLLTMCPERRRDACGLLKQTTQFVTRDDVCVYCPESRLSARRPRISDATSCSADRRQNHRAVIAGEYVRESMTWRFGWDPAGCQREALARITRPKGAHQLEPGRVSMPAAG
jgi:hypothetical protein